MPFFIITFAYLGYIHDYIDVTHSVNTTTNLLPSHAAVSPTNKTGNNKFMNRNKGQRNKLKIDMQIVHYFMSSIWPHPSCNKSSWHKASYICTWLIAWRVWLNWWYSLMHAHNLLHEGCGRIDDTVRGKAICRPHSRCNNYVRHSHPHLLCMDLDLHGKSNTKVECMQTTKYTSA